MLAEFIRDALERQREFLSQAVDDLDNKELTWQPTSDSNSIGWILWHMFRVEDTWIQFFIQNNTEIWERQNWNTVFGLPVRDNGFGHSSKEVTDFPSLDLSKLLEYGAEVRKETLEYLTRLDTNQFTIVPRARRPNLTVADVFRQIVGEIYQHTGQIAYIKGMRRGAHAFPSDYTAPN